MKSPRPLLLLSGVLAFLLCFSPAQALTVKPNVAPVVSGPIGDRSVYLQTSGIVDLSPFFRDPDASAAVLLTTSLGTITMTLDGEQAPITVANFLRYVDEGRYFTNDATANSVASLFVHRSAPGFVIQTGGFLGTVNPNGSGNVLAGQVATFPPIQNEPFISNIRGTIAMAKLGGDPNSATSQWFVNLADNSANLDNQNGGFTVFGRVTGSGMSVVDAIAALPIVNAGSPFDSLPVRNYTSPNPIKVPNLVSIPGFVRTSPFTFTATSSNPSVAAVSTSGTQLLIAGLQIGSAQVTVTATDLDGVAVSQSFNVNITTAPGRLRNISTRVNFPAGNEELIGGFIIRGGTSKRLVVRAIGPSLANVGVNGINNPTLELRAGDGSLIASNDNWVSSPDRQLLTDLGLAPIDNQESALFVTVPSSAANTNYTAIVRSVANVPGVALVEVFDLDSAAGATILNVSTRGQVGTGNNVMIGGFITQGTEARRLAVRALGPSLAQFNVPGTLPDPTLELRDAQGAIVKSNNDWQTGNPEAAELQSIGLAPSDARESALIATVPSGAYTAVVAGNGSQPTGVALVEVFQFQ